MITHPFTLARQLARRAMAYQRAEFTGSGASSYLTGRLLWTRRHQPLGEVTRRLSGLLDAYGITGRKTRGAVRTALPRAYACVLPRRQPDLPLTLAQRADRRALERAFGLAWQAPAGCELKHFGIIERRKDATRLCLIAGSWWHEYSRQHGSRRHEVQVLTGFEDGQWWARRVPYSVRSIEEALNYLCPAEVKEAFAAGRAVLRQGDVWLVQLKAGRSNYAALEGTSHQLRGTQLVHPEHQTVELGHAAWRAHLSKDTTRAMRTAARFD